MYRQPENSNRVKSMKSRFEGLNTPNTNNNIKKKSPVRTTVSTISVNVKIHDKPKKMENNNNDYKNSSQNPSKIKNEESNSKKKEKYLGANRPVKDFSSVNKKELCTAPPLNLTRQLNDPSKKGCIKRTPAFRKDKLVNNRIKNSEDNFANIVKLFEGNNSELCDTLEEEDKSTNHHENTTSDFKVTLISKQKLTSSSSTVEISKSQIEKPKLTTSTSLILDNKQPTQNNTATLKISEKENHTVPSIKELIQTLTNSEHKSLLNDIKTKNAENAITLPMYAQVDKSKKKENITDVALTDTLKAALKQPLPTGPPPKKPPRTFAHTPLKTPEESSSKTPEENTSKTPELEKKPSKIKSDPKLMLQKLENALLNNKIRSPKLPKKLTTPPSSQKNLFPNCLPSLSCVSRTSAANSYAKINSKAVPSNLSTFFTENSPNKREEPIYAEPFEAKNSQEGRFDTLSSSLHYMSNPVCDWNQTQSPQQDFVKNSPDSNSKPGEVEPGPLTRQKLNLIMNHTYASPSPSDSDMDSLPSTPSSDDTPSRRNTIKDLILNFEQKQQQLEPTSLNIPAKKQLTMSSSCPAEQNQDLTIEEKKKFKTQLNRTLTEIRKTYVKRVCSTLKRKTAQKTETNNLFECCLLVELNVSDLLPYIKKKYPENTNVPPWVEHLCFPDASEWSNSSNNSQDCQCYSLVITDAKGDRKYGYCRRVVPEETCVCLPLTYCIISSYRAAGFYHKILQELESRHGLPFGLQEAFVRELHNSKFPLPGESVQISCSLRHIVMNSCEEMIKNEQIVSPENVECVKRIVNMQNGVYGCVNNKTSNNLSEDWALVNKEDFQTPKNTYPVDSFAKISKYSKDYRRCNSLNNSSDSINSVDQEILRPKVNQSFVHQNQNCRSSEPQINKRMGQLFNDKMNDSTDSSQLLNLPNSQLLHDCLLGDVVIKRPLDSRLEDADLTTLFNTLNLDTLMQTFGSLLHERKVIFVSNSLSKLSACIEALQSILYPFNWQHTFIPVLSNNMLDILSAPLPLICGVLAAHITETLVIEDGIAVNLDTSTLVCYMGDENDIIPKRLQKVLQASLQLVSDSGETDDRTKNVFVSDAFIRMFVEVCGCYKQFIIVNDSGQKLFERESFINNHPTKSKCVRWFLEWFSETAMFNHFIQSHIDGEETESMFEQKCIEFNSIAMQKKVTQKVKVFSHKFFH